jgi:hypothetical protein
MRRMAERGLWILATCVAVRAVAVGDASGPTPIHHRITQEPDVRTPTTSSSEEQRMELTDSIIDHNLFRLAREPSSVPFESSATMSPSPLAPPAQRPPLVLAGIVGGPPWEALLEGIPGREGSVVARTGEEIAGFVLVRVDRRGVTLRGHDTTMVLAVRRAGQ